MTGLGIGITAVMWMAMMVAMMLPSVMPWIVALSATQVDDEVGVRRLGRTVLFGGGYFAVWAAFSLIAATLQVMLLQRGLMEHLLLGSSSYIGAFLLVGAGLYQLTPVKSACLEQCRSPIAFFLTSWRTGAVGAFRMGMEHGRYCVACCWALMALAFALGVMNLLWMVVLTIMLAAETVSRRGEAVSRAFGMVLVVWGIAVLVRGVPGS